MSCAQTQGFTKDCLNSIGGVKILYIGTKSEVASSTITAGAVTAMAMASTKKLWTYDVGKSNANFEEDMAKSLEAGTLFYKPKIDFALKKMTVATQNELHILAQNELVVAWKDNNGNYWIMGLENGIDLMERKAGSGKGLADMNGYTNSLSGEEPMPVYGISSAIIATLIVAAA